MSSDNPRIFIGYDCCAVYDAFDMTRCFKCNDFHHTANNCRRATSYPKCSENHEIKDCNSTTLKCSNCVASNANNKSSFDISHAVWDKNCPTYCLLFRKFKSQVFNK